MPAQFDPSLHWTRLGRTGPWRTGNPTGVGDLIASRGLALHFEGDTLIATIRTWNGTSPFLLEYELPLIWTNGSPTGIQSGGMIYRRNIGTMYMASYAGGGGLYVDPDTGIRFCMSAGEYDTNPAIAAAMSYATIDPATGKLGPSKRLYLSVGDKRATDVCRVPKWFADTHLGGGVWYAAMGGGYRSVIAVGGASLGPSVSVFQLSEGSSESNLIPCKDLQTFPFGLDLRKNPRQHRRNDYWQEFPDDRDPTFRPFGPPTQPYLTGEQGVFTNGEMTYAGMTWFDHDDVSGPVMFIAEMSPTQSQIDSGKPACGLYGHNDGSLNPCCNCAGQKACINTSARRHTWYTTPIAAMADVAAGRRDANTVQSTWTDVQFPGVKYPLLGLPSLSMFAIGAATVRHWSGATISAFLRSGGIMSDGTNNAWPMIEAYVRPASGAVIALPPASNVRQIT